MTTNRKVRVAFYARVSTTHEAQMAAFDNQIDWYKAELTKHPEWELYKIYSDKGISGTSTKKRDSFMEMYADALAGRFEKLVTREVSRFSRSIEDIYAFVRKFRECGVEVIFVNDNITTEEEADMTYKLGFTAINAQEESRKVSIRAKAGQKVSMAKGTYFGNGNILGYARYESKRPGEEKVVSFEIVEEQAETVRMIYDMYLSGTGLSLIKDELERQGRLTAQGKTGWHESNISKILKNSFYYGVLTYHKEFVDSYVTQKRCKNRGEIAVVTAQGTHTPIVTKEEFDQVQAIMASRSSAYKRDTVGKKPILDVWGKLLRCSCGHSVNREHYSGSGENKKIAYRCREVIRNGTPANRAKKGLPHEGYCNSPQVQQWKLDFMASCLFRDFIPHKNEVVDLAGRMLQSYLKDAGEDDTLDLEIENKQAELAELNKQKQNSQKFLLSGTLDELEYREIRSRLDSEIATLSTDIEMLIKERNENNTKETLEERIQRLQGLLGEYVDGSGPDKKIPQTIVSAFFKSIIICEDHFEWYLRTDGSEAPIACTVKGREKSREFFLLSSFSGINDFSPISYPPHRPLSRANIS